MPDAENIVMQIRWICTPANRQCSPFDTVSKQLSAQHMQQKLMNFAHNMTHPW